MDNRAIRAAADRRNGQLLWGTVAGVGLVGMRLLSAAVAMFSDDPGPRGAVAAFAEAALSAYLVHRMQRRRLWAAVSLLIIWATGFLYAWYITGSFFPPLAIISLSIGVGLAAGVNAILDMRAAAAGDSGEAAV